MKYCKWCEKTLPLEDFGKRQSKCRACASKAVKEYYHKNPLASLLRTKRWRRKQQIERLIDKLNKLLDDINLKD